MKEFQIQTQVVSGLSGDPKTGRWIFTKESESCIDASSVKADVKFTVDNDAMRQSSEILSGISVLSSDQWDAEEHKAISPEVLEICTTLEGSSLDRNLGLKVTVAAGFWYLMGGEDSERHERLGLLEEFCRASSALAVVVRLPPAHRLDSEASGYILRFLKKWLEKNSCPLYFEPGREGPPSWLDPAFCVVDPLWSPRNLRSDYWKIHGWHAERWVRTYPCKTLISLAQRAERLTPRFIILGHSQRKRQYHTLKSALGK